MDPAPAISPTCPMEGNEPDGPLVIEPEQSRVVVAILMLIFGSFFSGIPAVLFIAALRKNFLLGALCPGIFLVIGLCIELIALSMLLKCFNPRPILALSQRNIYPGTEFEVSWIFKGNAQSIRKWTLTLIGKEKVSYRQGTSTRTEESPFYEKVILETQDPNIIAKGFELVQLPADAMHSFKSSNNEILWLVQTHGDVAWWPDVDDAFPIRVLTLPVEETHDA